MKCADAAYRLTPEAGVCLAEAIIAMAAGAVVLSATIQSLMHFQHRLSAQHVTVTRSQDQRIGMQIMEDELRLGGVGTAGETAILKAESQEIEFVANADGLRTTLTQPATPAHTELTVADGTDWRKGKRINVCADEVCAEGRLAKDGRRFGLTLAAPLGRDLPAGSQITVSNRVRYYLGQNQHGIPTLMRQLDGGTNPIVGEVSAFHLSYFDQAGQPTADLGRIARVRIGLSVGDGRRTVHAEVALRAK